MEIVSLIIALRSSVKNHESYILFKTSRIFSITQYDNTFYEKTDFIGFRGSKEVEFAKSTPCISGGQYRFIKPSLLIFSTISRKYQYYQKLLCISFP